MQKNLGGALQSEAWRIFIHEIMSNIIMHTFAITEEVDRNNQTTVAWANPRDQACTNSKDQ
jgi:hypothetical protein